MLMLAFTKSSDITIDKREYETSYDFEKQTVYKTQPCWVLTKSLIYQFWGYLMSFPALLLNLYHRITAGRHFRKPFVLSLTERHTHHTPDVPITSGKCLSNTFFKKLSNDTEVPQSPVTVAAVQSHHTGQQVLLCCLTYISSVVI